MGKVSKTNVMRLLELHNIPYRAWQGDDSSGQTVQQQILQEGMEKEQIFKTLVTVGKSKEHYVFMVPIEAELDLKKAANSVKEKSIQMIQQKELLSLTGYVHGGCSPIGMKKEFQTVIDETACLYEMIIFSAGQVGHSGGVRLDDIQAVKKIEIKDLMSMD